MNKNILIFICLIFLCGESFSQGIFAPLNPTAYGVHDLRHKTDSAMLVPEKSILETNTYDTTAQIFYLKTDSSFYGWSRAKGFWKIGTGSGGSDGTTIVYVDSTLDTTTYLGHQLISVVRAQLDRINHWDIDTTGGMPEGSILAADIINKVWHPVLLPTYPPTPTPPLDDVLTAGHTSTQNATVGSLNITGTTSGASTDSVVVINPSTGAISHRDAASFGGGSTGSNNPDSLANHPGSDYKLKSDSTANSGYATVYRLNKVRDSVQANVDVNTANILLKKDKTDSSNSITGYTTLYQNSLKQNLITTSEQEVTLSSSTATFTSVPASYADYQIFRNGVLNESVTMYTTTGNAITGFRWAVGDRIVLRRIK